MKLLSLSAVGCILWSGAQAIIEPMKHDVIALSPRNLVDAFSQYRDRFPGGILFYKDSAKAATFVDETWNALAKDLKGMVKIGAVNCQEHGGLCRQELTPDQLGQVDSEGFVVQIFPPLPMPSMPTTVASKDKLKARLLKLLPKAKYEHLTTEEGLKKFVEKDANIPKVFLYSEKPAPGALWHGLIHNFGDRLSFAHISDKSLAAKLGLGLAKKGKQYRGVPVTPPLMAIKIRDTTMSAKGVEIFRGDIKVFHELQDWLNVHSETFARGGGVDLNMKTEHYQKPWLSQQYPELTKGSHKDLCFGLKSEMCGIMVLPSKYVSREDDTPATSVQQIFDALKAQVKKPALKYSWVDLGREQDFARALSLETVTEPSFVILNPHKRLRFAAVNNATTTSTVLQFVEQVKSGDGRFKLIKGGVPQFASKLKKEEL